MFENPIQHEVQFNTVRDQSIETSGPRPVDRDQRTETSGPRPVDRDQWTETSGPRLVDRDDCNI